MPSDEAVIEDPVLTSQREWARETLARQHAVLLELEAEAAAASDPVQRGLWWLAVRRQASARLRVFDRPGHHWVALLADEAHRHRVALEELHERSCAHLEDIDEGALRQARARLSTRVAVVGKGGSGKTLIASTLARLLARRGRHVLAVDLDPNPGLAFGLGMTQTDAGLPREALDRDDDGGWLTMLAPDLHAMDAVERFAVTAPDGVRYLGIGKITDPERTAFRRSMGPLFQILFNVAHPEWDVVGDLEAGGSTPFQGYHHFADVVLLVVEPSWKSALTARRLQQLVRGVPTLVIANRFRDEPDHPGLEPFARVPHDPAVIEADLLGRAPLDHCPDGPAVQAIARIADQLTTEEVLV